MCVCNFIIRCTCITLTNLQPFVRNMSISHCTCFVAYQYIPISSQYCANGYCVIIFERIILKLDMAIDHIIMYPMIYLVWLYLQDWQKYYRLKSVSFFFRHPVGASLIQCPLVIYSWWVLEASLILCKHFPKTRLMERPLNCFTLTFLWMITT